MMTTAMTMMMMMRTMIHEGRDDDVGEDGEKYANTLIIFVGFSSTVNFFVSLQSAQLTVSWFTSVALIGPFYTVVHFQMMP